MNLIMKLIIAGVGLAIVAGCTPTSIESTPDSSSPTDGVPPNATPVPEELPTDEPDAGLPTAAPLTGGEVPQEIFDAVLADLLAVTGATKEEVTLVSGNEITWNDGSLGCPQPDVMYTQALVDGYQIIFTVDGVTYDYHLDKNGTFFLCGNSLSPGNFSSTPSK